MAKKVQEQERPARNVSKCSVCMETNAHVAINCIHKFCMKCITKWVKRNQSCPLCRAEIREVKYGTRVKKVERKRKRQRMINPPSPRLGFRIAWKPVFFIGVPCMPSYMQSPFFIPTSVQ